MSNTIQTADILAFHDQCVAKTGWARNTPARFKDGLWQYLELNHRYNNLLWSEEDLARRQNVSDSEIATNKRNIDDLNQKRHDAVECMDEALLASLGAPPAGSRLNSETAGNMIDRLSILSLKLFHMGLQTQRAEAGAEHIATCQAKLARLNEQRTDLASCLTQLLADCHAGRAYFKVYRQFKMYNDVTLNPCLYDTEKV